MAKQMIEALRPGEPVDAVFLVADCTLRTTRAGAAYLDMVLQDRLQCALALAACEKVDLLLRKFGERLIGRREDREFRTRGELDARSLDQSEQCGQVRLGGN